MAVEVDHAEPGREREDDGGSRAAPCRRCACGGRGPCAAGRTRRLGPVHPRARSGVGSPPSSGAVGSLIVALRVRGVRARTEYTRVQYPLFIARGTNPPHRGPPRRSGARGPTVTAVDLADLARSARARRNPVEHRDPRPRRRRRATTHRSALLRTASVGKVFLLVEVADRLERGVLDPQQPLRRDRVAPVADSGLWQHLASRRRSRSRDVACLVGAVSDNWATNVLLDLVGLAAVQAAGPRRWRPAGSAAARPGPRRPRARPPGHAQRGLRRRLGRRCSPTSPRARSSARP